MLIVLLHIDALHHRSLVVDSLASGPPGDNVGSELEGARNVVTSRLGDDANAALEGEMLGNGVAKDRRDELKVLVLESSSDVCDKSRRSACGEAKNEKM